MFISALKESGSQSAITGANVNDVASLKAASSSYCLGVNGCTVAKLTSDFVVLDNDFNSIKNSIRWGRNLLLNVRRFVQFSLSAGITCIIIISLSAAVFGRSPFTLQQILLIDMFSGIGAAVSLATEAPYPQITLSERRKD